jgi:hypothetical protein
MGKSRTSLYGCREEIYKRRVFNVNGFISHIQVRSGDDDLFINEAAFEKKQLSTILQKALRILKQNLRTGLRKRRHVTTANHYKKI